MSCVRICFVSKIYMFFGYYKICSMKLDSAMTIITYITRENKIIPKQVDHKYA